MALAALLALALLWNAAAAAEAVRRGVTLCLTSVIPALFPFFAVSSLLVSLGAGDAVRVLERPFRALFRCGGAGAAAFLLGMIGGYPVGASTVAALVRRGDVSLAEGRRLLAFCNNAGPAFIIGVAGLTVFGSARVGAYLYLIHITAPRRRAFCSVAAIPPRRARTAPRPAKARCPPFSPRCRGQRRPWAVSAPSWCSFWCCCPWRRPSPERCRPGRRALELTNGILRLSPTRSGFVTAAALLGWGGLSVHGQTASVLEGTGLSMTRYFAGKAVQAALSALLAWGAWHVMTAVA